MKKLSLLVLAVATLLLGACSSTQDTKKETTVQVVVQVTVDGKSEREEVTVAEGDSVMEVLASQHQVTEENGLITAIDGVSQDTSTNTYWLYKVNGKMAEKGAKDVTVSNGDEIEFYLETFN
ncbi:DUF4430 domain-containing protein [Streptococcus suis]|nr:DUF4430 domain-containing protein [Streptococcus suis]